MTDEKERGFTVIDRRHGREDEDAATARESATPPPHAREAGGRDEPPAVDFATFVLSLSTSAFVHMGLVPEQEGAEAPPPNLPMARQTIDILELLEAKTRGNLDPEEAHLLESLLYELRMRFVEVQGHRS